MLLCFSSTSQRACLLLLLVVRLVALALELVATVAAMSGTRALLARLEALEQKVEAAVSAADQDATAREQMLLNSRHAVETRCFGAVRELLSQHETELFETAADISAACVAREMAAALPRLRGMVLTEHQNTQHDATTPTDIHEVSHLRRTIVALQAQVDSLRKEADETHSRYETAMTTQVREHQQTVHHLEAQIAAERSQARLDRETDADFFAKQVLQAETRAAAAERRAENAEAKMKQLELAAREWTGRVGGVRTERSC